MQKNVFELVSFLPFNINEKKKASKRGKKEYDEKRIVKILIFKSYAIPKRIGLRGVKSEQIQANSSFFRAVAKFFNI